MRLTKGDLRSERSSRLESASDGGATPQSGPHAEYLINWQSLLPITDDFVVFPADGSHNFMDDIGDLLASISPSQEQVLRSRNLIPSSE